MSEMELALTPEFQDSLLDLGHQKQVHVQQAIAKLLKNPVNSGLHKLEGLPFHAFYVNQGAFRVVCRQEGNLLVLLHVGAHDAAYLWASNHKVVRIGKIVRIMRTSMEDDAPDDVPAGQDRPLGPLAHFPDKTFKHFGLTPGVADVLRAVPDENVLIETLEWVRPPMNEALLNLATDPDALQIIVRDFHDALRALEARETAPEPAPLREVITETVNSAALWLAPTDAQLLEEMLKQSLETWRLFLHPTQRRLVNMDTSGAYKVTGGPGTGKTVVALHRARRLAEHMAATDPRPILLTTFSRVLARELEHGFGLLCADAPHLRDRVVVKTIARTAMDLLDERGRPSQLLEDDVIEACWASAMNHETLGRKVDFYRAEREHVVARNGAWTEGQYLQTPRRGRSSRINRVERRAVWRVLEAFEDALSHRHGGDTASLAREATDLVVSGQLPSPYAAIICDELQDISASELRLLSALARDPVTGKTRPNGLFLAGDNYQSLYRAPVVLSSCGIEVRGNASVLRRNYRTTEGIRRAAIEVVQGISFSDDEDEGEVTSLHGYTSERGGPRPEHLDFATAEAEADWIASQATDGPWPLLVLVRTNAWLDSLSQLLQRRGITPKHLGPHESLSGQDQVVLCTLHRSKGLEAPRVIIAGKHQLPRPWNGKGDPGDKLIWERQEKCLLYVGMTRARDWCALTGLRK